MVSTVGETILILGLDFFVNVVQGLRGVMACVLRSEDACDVSSVFLPFHHRKGAQEASAFTTKPSRQPEKPLSRLSPSQYLNC